MGNAGGHSPLLKTISTYKAQPLVPGVKMAFKHSRLHDILFQADARCHSRSILPGHQTLLCEKFMRLELYNTLHGSLLLQHQVLQGNLIHAEGVKYAWERSFQVTGRFSRRAHILPGSQAYSLSCRQDAVLVYSRHPKLLQILKHCQIRPQPRHDSSPVLQPKILRRIKSPHLNGPYGVRSHGHCPADDIINVPHGNQVAWMLVICHQHTSLIIGGLKQGHKRFQVPGSRALPYHDPLSPSKFFQGFPCIRTLVVRPHAGAHISIQLIPSQERRVAVYNLAAATCLLKLLHQILLAGNHSH